MNNMQPMGNEKPGLPNFPGRPTSSPFPTVPQATSPFISPGRPTSSPFATVPQVTSPFASSGPEVGYRGSPPAKVNGPSMPPPQLPYASSIGSHQRFPTQQFPSSGQTMPSLPGQPSVGQPMLPPPVLTSSGQQPLPPPVSYRPQSQIPSVPMGPPPQSLNFMPSNGNVPYRQADPLTQVPPPPMLPYLAQQGGYLPPPPLAASVGFNTREQMQHPTGGPPIGSVQGLVEDFGSISLGSVPGSIDPGVDPKALPRPLDGDVEPKSFAEMYPLNCHPKFFRLTTSAIPSSKSLITRWHLPLGAVVHPLAESSDVDEVPIVNFGPCGVIRCRRCRTYVNPYVSFTDMGRKWRCNICDLNNDVPSEYFAQLDANGRRVDANQRPELIKGSVEFVAPTEYMVRPPMPPLYFFLIDVSVTAVRSGMLEIVAKTIKSCLDELPGFPRTQIGFLTFDSTLHFYNMKSSLAQPQMMVVSDLDDIFVPLPDDLLVNLSESRNVVDVFLDCMPSMFQNNVNVESAFGPALKAAYMVMSQLGGKLLIFQSTLPSLGIGRLRLRGDDPHIYGTDKESTLRLPDDPFYKQMAADFSKFQISVNVYAFSDNYTDIASLGTLAKYTGGQVYYYPRFEGAIHGEKLRYELARDLTRETAWEAVMRIRCGKGVRFSAYHGNFMLRSTDLLALPAVDCDKAFGMQLCLEDTLITTQTVYFQVALLYTSSSGERRIRVHTVAAPVVTDLGEMYRQADTGSTINLLSRLAIEKALSEKLEGARGFVQSKIVKSLREYKILNSHHRLVGRLIFPESLRYLFLYGLALCKSLPLRGGYNEAQLDERCAAGYTMMTMSVRRLLKFLYPTLIRLDEYLTKAGNIDDLGDSFKRLPLAVQYLNSRGLYIYDDGFRIIIWLGRELSSEITSNLLGAELSGFHDLSKVSISERENEVSRKLMAVLKKFKESDPSYYQLCYLVRQGEQPRESSLLLGNLIEDQMGGTSSYVDWIMQINRQVQQNA